MSKPTTHMANASGRPLQVYYCPREMSLEEIEVVFGTRASDSKSEDLSHLSADVLMSMRRNTQIHLIRIPVNDYGKILTDGAIYVTVFMDEQYDCGKAVNIAHNFYVPSDRSFIVTANCNLKFQKFKGNIWEDEGGHYHRR